MDVEGLRRRRGREPRATQPVGPVRVQDQAGGESVAWELGVPLNVCVLGALVMLGLGVLLFSGEWDVTAGSCVPVWPPCLSWPLTKLSVSILRCPIRVGQW